ncbi:DUF4870 family protein [Limnobacter sp.]|uniref:DUF4870 family protein n=1 Tax=Limnobacter sp. TaxID=2003368 RepID=UPI0035130962
MSYQEVGMASESHNSLPPNSVQLIYILYAIGFVFGLTYLIAGIISTIKRSDESNDFLKSHYVYQSRTFWWSLVWLIAGFILSAIIVGWFVLIANYIWSLYRVIKGWLAFSERKRIGI